jgi:hypothetical protein
MTNYFKPTVTAKLPETVLEKIDKNYLKITGTNKPMTFKEYLENLLDFALASIPEDGLSLPEALNVIADANQQLADRQHELIVAQQELAEARKQPKNTIAVKFTASEIAALNDLCNYENKRTGHQVTPEILLRALFTHQLMYGPGDWLPKNYSKKQLAKFNTPEPEPDTDNTPQNINELTD